MLSCIWPSCSFVIFAHELVVAKNPVPWNTVWHLSYHVLPSLESLNYNERLKNEAGQLGKLSTKCPYCDWDQTSRYVARYPDHYTMEAYFVCHNTASWSESQLSLHISHQNSNTLMFLKDTLEIISMGKKEKKKKMIMMMLMTLIVKMTMTMMVMTTISKTR